MLQVIKSKVTGAWLWAIVVMVSAGFLFVGSGSLLQQKADEEAVGSVNGDPIYKRELDKVYNAILQSVMTENVANLPHDIERMIRKQALDRVILSSVIREAAKKIGLYISNSYIDSYVTNQELFQTDGVFSNIKFERFLANAGYRSMEGFYNSMKTQLMLEQINIGILESEFATKNEYTEWANMLKHTRDVEFIKIPASYFEKDMSVPDNEIKKYYEENQPEFKQPELVSLQYLELDLSEIKDKTEISKEQVEDYYNQHQESFSEPQQWKVSHILLKDGDKEQNEKTANEILAKLTKGEDFAKLAKKHSQDQQTAEQGGELFWLQEGRADSKIIKAISELNNKGDLTNIVTTYKGLEIFKLIDYKPHQQKKLSEVENNIREILVNNNAQRVFADLSEELEDLAYNEPQSLKTAAKELNLTIKQTDYFYKDAPDKYGIVKYPQVREVAYSDDVYKQKNNSTLLVLEPTKAVVVRAHEIVPEKIKELAKVKSDIKNKLIQRASRNRASEVGKEIHKKLVNGKEIKSDLNQYSLSWEQHTNLPRADKSLDPEINLFAFSYQLSNDKSLNTKTTLLSNGDFLVLRLRAINPVKLDQLSESEEKEIRQTIVYHHAESIRKFYFDSLEKMVNVKLDIER